MYARYAKLRDAKGVTDYKVAEDTGIPKTTLYEWRDGAYTPKIDKLQKLAEYFDVSLDYLVSGKETT